MTMQQEIPAYVKQIPVLDEIDMFVSRFVSCTDQQRHAMILYAAATHAIRQFATFPRMLFASLEEESGKTLAMTVTACLCSRNLDAAGTSFDLVSALAEASLEPEKPVPTIIRDEIGEVFPGGGQGRGNNVVGDILRRGYKKRSTRGRSRGGQSQRYSIYTPFLMTGLRTAVPRDIRTRCIVLTMEKGTPREYFDVRDAEEDALTYGRVLGKAVREHAAELGEFRILRLNIPGLRDRKAEVWEPLFAVALALGGAKWLARAKSAFLALSLADSDAPELTPGLKLLKAAVEVAPRLTIDGFVPGRLLANELRRLPQYDGHSEGSMSKQLADVMPVRTTIRRLSTDERMRGYTLLDLLNAWESLRPKEPDEIEPEEEVNPFDVLEDEPDEDEDLEHAGTPADPPGTGGAGGTGSTAPLPVVPGAAVSSEAPLEPPEPQVKQRSGSRPREKIPAGVKTM